MRGVIAGQSVLRPGDWLLVPDSWVVQQPISLEGAPVELRDRIELSDLVPLRTVWCYYGGRGPLRHRDLEDPRLTVQLYRVTARFVPPSPEEGGE